MVPILNLKLATIIDTYYNVLKTLTFLKNDLKKAQMFIEYCRHPVGLLELIINIYVSTYIFDKSVIGR